MSNYIITVFKMMPRFLQRALQATFFKPRCVSSLSKDHNRHDVIVVGLGSHGSAALYHLTKAGLQVLGIERFSISHSNASHHGESRMTRMAYIEGPEYVPLLRRAYELYSLLEQETRQQLFWQTGVLNIGYDTFEDARTTAVDQSLPHEVLTAHQAQQRFPGLKLPPDMPVMLDVLGGILAPEKMIQAHVGVAQYHGATVKTEEQVLGWSVLPDGSVEVQTSSGCYRADSLVLSSGAWMDQLVPELKGLCTPSRATVAWFQPEFEGQYSAARLPPFILNDGATNWYGFPEFGNKPGVKMGEFVSSSCNPDNLERQPSAEDIQPLVSAAQQYLAGSAGPVLDFAACMFVMTPDGHFVIDKHPNHPQVFLCSACSGHGFKFSPVLGEILADLVQLGRSSEFEHELRIHRLDRLLAHAGKWSSSSFAQARIRLAPLEQSGS